jgi:hypothetical protein
MRVLTFNLWVGAAILSAMVLAGQDAGAMTVDLGHPTLRTLLVTGINFAPDAGRDRNVAFDALASFDISSAGILFDPLAGGATEISVEIWDMSLTGGVGSRNTLLASASTPITDNGLTFYDIPINFSFAAGTRYNVGFNSVTPDDWGRNINDMEFYLFDFPRTSYTVDGLVDVLDGGHGLGTDGGFVNGVMPHIRFNTTVNDNTVPEPITATLGLMGLGVLGMATRRRSA